MLRKLSPFGEAALRRSLLSSERGDVSFRDRCFVESGGMACGEAWVVGATRRVAAPGCRKPEAEPRLPLRTRFPPEDRKGRGSFEFILCVWTQDNPRRRPMDFSNPSLKEIQVMKLWLSSIITTRLALRSSLEGFLDDDDRVAEITNLNETELCEALDAVGQLGPIVDEALRRAG